MAASGDMEGTVRNLMNRLSSLPDVSKGEWIGKFIQVQNDVNANLQVMTQALTATGEDAKVAAGGFSEGDSQLGQQQDNVQGQVAGLTPGSFRV